MGRSRCGTGETSVCQFLKWETAEMKRNRNCIWHCGRATKNISRICDLCWANRESIYRARKTREAETEISPSKRVALTKANAARRAKRLEELPTSELSHA